MTTAANMYEIYPSFFSSTNEYNPHSEIIRLYTLDRSFPIAKFAEELILEIAKNLSVKSFLNLRSTSRCFQKTFLAMPEMNTRVAIQKQEYIMRLEYRMRRIEQEERRKRRSYYSDYIYEN